MTTGFNSKWKPQGRVVPGLGAPSEWKGPFYFAVLADPQLGLLENNESWAEELRLLRMAVRELNRLKPAFAVVVGDLVQQPPVASAADRDSAKSSVRLKQIGDFQEALGELDSGIPLMCAAGNHDVGNSPSSFSLERHIDAFGEDYFAWDFGGVRFIVLNSSVYWDPVGGGGGGVEALAEQQAWLERELETLQTRDGKEDKKETAKVPRAVVFSHHPFFLDSVDEEGGAAMGDLCIFGKSIPRSYFHIPKERRVPVLDKMREAGVRHVFSGHCHWNHEKVSEGIEQVVTSAVGMQLCSPSFPGKSGFRLVRVDEGSGIRHAFFAFEDLTALSSLSDADAAIDAALPPSTDPSYVNPAEPRPSIAPKYC
uniref:Calcineurin-like phosphoesterase domain-containing protein n=1 Tax=Chromera velia CCMP2878 TaxID=1169474 RepID=A0A0G4GHA0_9ALVE|mmetsp:Transcript_23351/g.45945  ORF Transcript_23351/g.45945 Transcript_23351/m.45945 type:complete len:368 (-) Transcript_23351:91-1194(-)|eukprot:Cvel_4719.t1-p1 / transcript=Cvel_4719.t1 / gene=Cvel_4719 / organism=Chromera_velia_CCMP2878 / gene_product=Calcineurin-like phosphoesterase domain-containing, putative / transcript_product=Calcineurin-like phosphoesterase domain-containing, putative / location=Cvel_scaffold209:107369-109665(+) / protein_length=367 / sequence_SO=supercontig / SO=protein_coding / is_pseudo=false